MVYDLEAFDTLIKSRRSVFPQDYTGEPISDVVVKKILETAVWAPTHKVTQPWRFIVFAGGAIKKFAEQQAGIYRKVTEADGTFKENKFQSLLTKPLLSSHIVAVIMHRHEDRGLPEVEELGAVFCAIQNIYLASTAYGVGGYLSTGGITYFEETKSFLGIGENDKVVGFFHLGTPARVPSPLKRKPLEEVCTWVQD